MAVRFYIPVPIAETRKPKRGSHFGFCFREVTNAIGKGVLLPSAHVSGLESLVPSKQIGTVEYMDGDTPGDGLLRIHEAAQVLFLRVERHAQAWRLQS